MQRAGGGSIVNISSIAGIVGRPLSSPAYAASKGAVRVLTKSTAGRFASENIRCNSVQNQESALYHLAVSGNQLMLLMEFYTLLLMNPHLSLA